MSENKENLKRSTESEVEIQDSPSGDTEVMVEIVPGWPQYVNKYVLKFFSKIGHEEIDEESDEESDDASVEKGEEESETKEELSQKFKTELKSLADTVKGNKRQLRHLQNEAVNLMIQQENLEKGIKKMKTIAAKLDKQINF